MAADKRRVVVTGIGVIASCGTGKEAFWNGLLAPQPTGERRIPDFDPNTVFDTPKEAKRLDRFTQIAVAAAAEAVEHAGGLGDGLERGGVYFGAGVGGISTIEEQVLVLANKGPRRVTPFLVPMMMSNASAAALSMRWGLQGPCETTVTACAASTHAIANGARAISDGRCDLVLTGGSEAAMVPVGIQGFANMTALSSSGVSRPFDAERDGFIMTEGAAVLVLEERERAIARGATILAEILGSGSNADAHHITAPSPGGEGAERCMRIALEDAGVTPDQVVHINAHGTSTPHNDASEAGAINRIFGEDVVVTSTKGVTGHGLGAAGAIEASAIVLAMQHKLIPPTDGTKALDPTLPKIDLVLGEPRPWEPGISLSNSFGFGGHNGTLVIAPAS